MSQLGLYYFRCVRFLLAVLNYSISNFQCKQIHMKFLFALVITPNQPKKSFSPLLFSVTRSILKKHLWAPPFKEWRECAVDLSRISPPTPVPLRCLCKPFCTHFSLTNELRTLLLLFLHATPNIWWGSITALEPHFEFYVLFSSFALRQTKRFLQKMTSPMDRVKPCFDRILDWCLLTVHIFTLSKTDVCF